MSRPPPTLRDIYGQTVYHGDRVYYVNVGLTGVVIYDLEKQWWWFYSDIESDRESLRQQRCGVTKELAPHAEYGIIKLGGKVAFFRGERPHK